MSKKEISQDLKELNYNKQIIDQTIIFSYNYYLSVIDNLSEKRRLQTIDLLENSLSVIIKYSANLPLIQFEYNVKKILKLINQIKDIN